MKSNDICKLLNIKYPIFQGAMAWVSDSNLAAAVSNAGGLGIIAGGNSPAEVVRDWMNSPGHRANILEPSYVYIGVGYCNDYWVQQFGDENFVY